MGNDLPIRPRPMKPHVSRFRLLDAKDLFPVGSIDLGAVLLPSMQSLAGENRTEMAALMTGLISRKEGKEGKEVTGGNREPFSRSRGRESDVRQDSWDVDCGVLLLHKIRVFARTLCPHVMHCREDRVGHVQICAFERYNQACSSRCSRACRTDFTPAMVVSVGCVGISTNESKFRRR